MPGFHKTNCVFNCSATAEDSLEHYCRCKVLASIFGQNGDHPIDEFFMVNKDIADNEKLNGAKQIYVVLRLVHFARLHGCAHDWRLLADIERNKT